MNKKIIAFLLTISFILSLSCSTYAVTTTLGDIDSDGKITASDARIALRASVGLVQLSEKEFLAADADKNKTLSSADARLILRAAVGLASLDKNSNSSDSSENLTIAERYVKEFRKEAVKPNPTTNKIATALSTNTNPPFFPMVQDMEEGYLAGFDDKIKGFSACTAFMPMIGTIPFVSYVFELPAKADKNAFIKNLKKEANLAWNICTSADEIKIDYIGNFVFFIMAPLSFEQDTNDNNSEIQNTPTQKPDAPQKPSYLNGSSVADICVTEFKKAAKKTGSTTNSIATAISINIDPPFMPMIQDMEAGYLAGFDDNIKGFSACTAFMPMIGTIPFVSYVFELPAKADKNAFINNLKQEANLAWNICTKAEEMQVADVGNFVFFVMSPFTME